jgi:hypothetical protein
MAIREIARRAKRDVRAVVHSDVHALLRRDGSTTPRSGGDRPQGDPKGEARSAEQSIHWSIYLCISIY